MQFLKRTVYCGQVNESHLNKSVTLNGWVARRRDHGGLIFVDVRDRTGIVQLVIDPQATPALAELAHSLRSEFVLAVQGTIVHRAAGAINEKLATGRQGIRRHAA